MVSIPSCHDGYPGSIPGRRAPFFLQLFLPPLAQYMDSSQPNCNRSSYSITQPYTHTRHNAWWQKKNTHTLSRCGCESELIKIRQQRQTQLKQKKGSQRRGSNPRPVPDIHTKMIKGNHSTDWATKANSLGFLSICSASMRAAGGGKEGKREGKWCQITPFINPILSYPVSG